MNHYQNVPGWFNCPDLYSSMVNRAVDGAEFVEIGCWKGKSSSYMAEKIQLSGKKIKFNCVDTWRGTTTESHHQQDPDVVNDRLMEVFHNNMSPFAGLYNAIRTTSLEAAKMFADKSLDFVYIDASHEYQDVKDDINAWLPKVKPGGVIAGDDFNSAQVSKAVFETLTNVASPNRFTWVYAVK